MPSARPGARARAQAYDTTPRQSLSDETVADVHRPREEEEAVPSARSNGRYEPFEGHTGYGEDDMEDELEQDAQLDDLPDNTLPPEGLKEISSLASWTVTSSKPGCGVAALRSSDTSLFWQSDGPQPHTLSIHFFKLVSIVHMRIFLDFEADESYTPTKMQFCAGMGSYDLQEFAEMTFEQPKGWIDVDFSRVGPVADHADDVPGSEIDWDARPVLRAFLVQVRIIENHQNGKDTHLRGLQLFARDHSIPSNGSKHNTITQALNEMPVRSRQSPLRQKPRPITKAPWMLSPELR